MTLDGNDLEPRTPCVIAIPSITVHGFAFTGVDGWVLTMPDMLIERLLAHAPELPPHLDKPRIVDALRTRTSKRCSAVSPTNSAISGRDGCCRSRPVLN